VEIMGKQRVKYPYNRIKWNIDSAIKSSEVVTDATT
jgi:hypothetical protein